MVMAVGLVMGLHAAFEIFVRGVEFNSQTILTYLPVSILYILSMAIGYLGLRYIELSISSPICNSSGAIVAVLILITSGIGEDLPPIALVAVALVCIGVIALGFHNFTFLDNHIIQTTAPWPFISSGSLIIIRPVE